MNGQWTSELRERIHEILESTKEDYKQTVEEAKQLLAGQLLPIIHEAERQLKAARLAVRLEAKEIQTDQGLAPGLALSVQEPKTELVVWIEVTATGEDSVAKIKARLGDGPPVDVYRPRGGNATAALQEQIRALIEKVVSTHARRQVVNDTQASIKRTLDGLHRPGGA